MYLVGYKFACWNFSVKINTFRWNYLGNGCKNEKIIKCKACLFDRCILAGMTAQETILHSADVDVKNVLRKQMHRVDNLINYRRKIFLEQKYKETINQVSVTKLSRNVIKAY